MLSKHPSIVLHVYYICAPCHTGLLSIQHQADRNREVTKVKYQITHPCNPNTEEAEAGGLPQVKTTLSQNKRM